MLSWICSLSLILYVETVWIYHGQKQSHWRASCVLNPAPGVYDATLGHLSRLSLEAIDCSNPYQENLITLKFVSGVPIKYRERSNLEFFSFTFMGGRSGVFVIGVNLKSVGDFNYTINYLDD